MSYLNDNNDVKLIIADVNMPVISGFELLTQVRERFSDDELGVILLGIIMIHLKLNLLKMELMSICLSL